MTLEQGGTGIGGVWQRLAWPFSIPLAVLAVVFKDAVSPSVMVGVYAFLGSAIIVSAAMLWRLVSRRGLLQR
jgi:hypothetical protein